jgi:hypothetical protein
MCGVRHGHAKNGIESGAISPAYLGNTGKKTINMPIAKMQRQYNVQRIF